MLRVWQINLQHSKIASANLLIRLSDAGCDLVLIQEPWLVNGKVSGLGTRDYRVVVDNEAGRPRSCLLINNKLSFHFIPSFSNSDITTIGMILDSRIIWVISAYMAHDDECEPPPVTA